ncbi:PREDICTED: von Willebrand factor A domain-containing protein 1 [Miniopterus natalensis]|uniref:von Willebrand factor A domain-containing protein 1 n=1 Tax=Miniopterus natalensis TaxID=291302 RepID=UPI0007A6BCE5|nr:PREDICTED: von Willebrand factor A domain-containing protein 1 [Miniopterus natalensis]
MAQFHVPGSPVSTAALKPRVLESLGAKQGSSGQHTLDFGGPSPLLPHGAQAEAPGSFWSLPRPEGKLRPWGFCHGCGAVWEPPPGAEPSPSPPGPQASAPQGDLLFLLDSSASVSHYEFSRVREFLGQLAAPLPVGPEALRASLVHVSSRPHTEFPFGQHSSGAAVQDAIRAAAQLMGNTNTGLALEYVKEQLFAEAAGARPGVPKVLVWVTDGGSSDPVGPPMQELKDLGVTVFIVSTGRGNFLELSAAASAPAEKHLHFVDVDDLRIIAQELRDSILDAVQPQQQQLRASEVTSSGFRLAWPPLLTADSGYYVLELAPSAEPGTMRRRQLPGNATGWAWADLNPDTDYDVALVPESNEHPLKPQHLRVRTLPGEAGPWRHVPPHRSAVSHRLLLQQPLQSREHIKIHRHRVPRQPAPRASSGNRGAASDDVMVTVANPRAARAGAPHALPPPGRKRRVSRLRSGADRRFAARGGCS